MFAAAIQITPQYILMGVLAAIAGLAVAGVLFKVDSGVKLRRQNAVEAASEAKVFGLTPLVDIFTAIGTGDEADGFQEFHKLSKQIRSKDGITNMVKTVFDHALPIYAKDAKQFEHIQKELIAGGGFDALPRAKKILADLEPPKPAAAAPTAPLSVAVT